MIIALAGNPNSGKTTIYNALTGKTEKVGNWAGVTVERREALLKKSYGKENVTIVDLPGAYSMSPYTSEESITRDFVKNTNPDIIVNIVDSSNLERSLFFTSQLLELGIPTVIALNKGDIAERKNNIFDIESLEKELSCPIILTSALSGFGLQDLINKAMELHKNNKGQSPLKIPGIEEYNEKNAKENDLKRQNYVKSIAKKHMTLGQASTEDTTSDTIDRIVAHKIIGLPIFFAIMFVVFSISQTYVGPIIAEWLDALLNGGELFGAEIAGLGGITENFLVGLGVNDILVSLILDGVIGGVGAVVGFLPLIMVLFLLLSLLEDCGYMARVAVLLDPYFKKIGLSGKSMIPMIVGSGCGIPGIMATRTIKSEKERNMTAILTPFVPCGAKLPIIALFTSTFFGDSPLLAPFMYLLAIFIIVLTGLFIKAITGADPDSNFIMELPEYKLPSITRAIKVMFDRASDFIKKAFTIILVCNMVVWFISTYSWDLQVVEDASTSILASVASPIALLIIPLGFGTWQFASAAVTGFIAKENVVGTLAVVFSITNLIDTEEFAVVGDISTISNAFGITAVAGFAFMAFNLFTPPCFAAIGAMRSEITDKKWLRFGVLLQFAVGYLTALTIYQFGTIIVDGRIADGFIAAIIIYIVSIFGIIKLINKQKKSAV
ncbi:MAG: ferrous iron transporter B [Lachnospirales bacterium]